MSGALRTDDNAASGVRRADSSSAIPLLAHTEALSERVYRAILQMLGQGSLARGAMLRINDLSTTLGVSATPVREALARLAATGLVVHEARKGYRIAPPPSAERLRALMDARKLIEAAAVVRACRDGGEAFRVELAAGLAAQRVEVENLHSTRRANRAERAALEWRVLEADLHFHHVIFDHAHNPFIRLMAQALNAQLHRVRQSAEHGLGDADQALLEHEAILKAVETGSPEAAEREMLRHMALVEKRSEADLLCVGSSSLSREMDEAAR